MDHRGRRSGPLRESWNVGPEGSVVDFIDENAEEGGGLVTRIRLELGIDLYDEGGGDGRKQTGLMRELASLPKTSGGAYEDQSGV